MGISLSLETKAADISINNQYGEKGSKVCYDVTLDSSPNDVAAFGFEVQYDLNVLRFKGCSAGYLSNGFDFFDGNNVSPGIVRVGGFTAIAGKIIQGESGPLVSLTFEVVGHDDCQIRIAELKDHIKDWSTRPGYFTGDHKVEEKIENDLAPEKDYTAESDLIPTNNNSDYSSTPSTPQSNQSKGGSTSSSFPTYTHTHDNNDNFYSLAEGRVTAVEGSARSHQNGKKRLVKVGFLKEKNTKEVISFSETRVAKHQTPTTTSELKEKASPNHRKEQTKVHTLDIYNMKQSKISMWQILMSDIYVFGAIFCTIIGLLFLIIALISWNFLGNRIFGSILNGLGFLTRKNAFK